jgi:hypothetical protein
MNWSYPANTLTTIHDVYAYDAIHFGAYAAGDLSPNGITPPPMQVNALTEVTGTFDVTLTGMVGRDDLLWENYLTAGPNSGASLFEVGFFLQDTNPEIDFSSSTPRYDFTTPDGKVFAIFVGTNGAFPFIQIYPIQQLQASTNLTMLSGTIDILAVLKFMASRGIITGKEYLGGWSLGLENYGGNASAGQMTINHLSYAWQ